MGCCSDKNLSSTAQQDIVKVRDAIDKSQLKKLTYLKSVWDKEVNGLDFIDQPIIQCKTLALSPLGYALVMGKNKAFVHLHKLGASFAKLEEMLATQSKSILEVICQFGYGEILEYFLQEADEKLLHSSVSKAEFSLTLDFEDQNLFGIDSKRKVLPIQLAVERGHLHIIDICYRYSRRVSRISSSVDIHYINEHTGENCALVACRKGQFNIVKYLNESCGANFFVVNVKNENALVIAACGSRKHVSVDYFDTFVYLIEEVKIGFLGCYEDVLVLLESYAIEKYFEKVLKKAGIEVDREEIEKKYKPLPANAEKKIEDNRVASTDIKILISPNESRGSFLSGIYAESSRLTQFFSSFFGLDPRP